MAGDFSRASAHPVPLSPEELRRRTFTNSFRGYDQGEVRELIESIAAELDRLIRSEESLRRELETARHTAATARLDEATLTAALGHETAQILHAAHEASADVRRKAEDNAARILGEAQTQADALRGASELVLGERTREADSAAETIRAAAQAEADAVVARARQQAESALTEARTRFDAMAEEAEALKSRVLGDLTRRRRTVLAQVEQLGAGRDSMLRAVGDVRRLIDEITGALAGFESEAKAAADLALERARQAEDVDTPVIEEVAQAAIGAGSLGEPPPPPESVEVPLYSLGAIAGPPVRIHAQPVGGAPSPRPAVTSAATSAVTPEAPAAPAIRVVGDGEESTVAERRISSLRILRRRDDRRHPSAGRLSETEEGVRIIRPGSARQAEPESGPAAATEAGTAAAASAAAGTAESAGAPVPPPAPSALPPPAAVEDVRSAAAPVEGQERGADEPVVAGRAETAPVESVSVESVPVEPVSVESVPAESVSAHPGPADQGATAAAEPEVDHAAVAAAAAEAAGPEGAEARSSVDELFARLRAEREAARAEAEAVLAALPAAEADPDDGGGVPDAGPGVEAVDPVGPPEDGDALLERRNRLAAPVQDRLSRRLKRALQDDQNDLLDRARSRGRHPDSDPLPDEIEHAARFRLAAAEVLDEAFAAGVEYALAVVPGARAADRPSGGAQAAVLAGDLVAELRARLTRAIGEPGLDEGGLTDAVGSVYRAWKGARTEGLAMDHVVACFGSGVMAASPSGALFSWVVDDDGGACPDCDDNSLAGPTTAGDAFPTGQVHPPAHAGCRCLLVPGLT